MQSKRSSVNQPRPTRASMLRQQGQIRVESPSPRPTPKKTTPKARASEGVREFMAAQRAAAAARKEAASSAPSSRVAPERRVMTGADRYTYDEGFDRDAAFGTDTPKTNLKLQTLLQRAKSSGKLDLSSRELKTIPTEVWDMYHVDPNKIVVDFDSSGDAWYDNTELVKLVATDNELGYVDERLGQEFGALVTLDLRSNSLTSMPTSLGLLQQLTVLNLSHNRFETIPASIFELSKLRDLDMAHNQIALIPKDSLNRLQNLEFLNLGYNCLEHVPSDIGQLSKLRRLSLNNNRLRQLPSVAEVKAWIKLEELLLGNNRLTVLFQGNTNLELPALCRIDVHHNCLTALAESDDGSSINLPNLKELLVARNQLSNDQSVALLHGTPDLLTLDISLNQFSELPTVLWSLTNLRRLDIGGNLLRSLPHRLGLLPQLAFLNWEGNPLRSAPRNVSMAQLIDSLRSKATLEDQDEQNGGRSTEKHQEETSTQAGKDAEAGMAGMATAATSTTTQPEPAVDMEVPKASGTLDLSRKGLNDVDSSLLTSHPVTLNLSHNQLTRIPTSLEAFARTLVNLKLDHNKIESLSLTSSIVFASLKTLDISHNRLSTITADDSDQISFPKLTELIINFNTITSLPENLPDLVPSLRILRANSNKIEQILPSSLQGLEIIDLANNDIAKLAPEIGLITSIRELVLYGNRFRVPRPALLDQGTAAVLEFLRGRIPQ